MVNPSKKASTSNVRPGKIADWDWLEAFALYSVIILLLKVIFTDLVEKVPSFTKSFFTTFPNGTSKVTWVNGTSMQFLDGIGVLIVDPSVSAAAAASASAPVSNTVVNRVYQAIAIAISITINNNTNNTIFEPLLPQTDEQCLFDPSLPHCAPVDGECPEGFGTNEEGQCFPRGGCPDGYHSVEDDESGTCYPDDIPCPNGQVRSEEGNYCIEPTEPEPEPVDCAPGLAFNPQSGECESFSLPVQGEDEQEQGQQLVEEPVEESEGNQRTY